jgi:hypothetical protein
MILSSYYEQYKGVKLDIKCLKCPNCKTDIEGLHSLKMDYTINPEGRVKCLNCYE